MKHILFIVYSLPIGGVEKSLINLIKELEAYPVKISLFLMEKKGELLDELPPDIEVLSSRHYPQKKKFVNTPWRIILGELIRQKQFAEVCRFFTHFMIRKLTGNCGFLYRYLFKDDVIPGQYDMAVAYAGPSALIDYFCAYQVQAKTKVGWIHFDPKMFPPDPKITRNTHAVFKKIYAVSETAKKNYLELFPEFSEKTDVFYNITNPRTVLRMANDGQGFDDLLTPLTKRILTVGRLSREKGQDTALETAGILLKSGLDFRWYFIGEGGSWEEFLKKKTQELGLADHICFLGKKSNPYPYLKACDLYVQPSKHEGFCISLAEAICFDAPIVATNFCGAREQLDFRANGFVSDHTPESLAKKCLEALKVGRLTLGEGKDVKTASPSRIQQFIKLSS